MKNVEDKTIGEIKEWLSSVKSLSSQEEEMILQDKRAGVKTLLKRMNQKKEKENALFQEHERLLHFERDLWSEKVKFVAGIDEVGRGPLAGPVVAAAVVFPHDVHLPGLTDSKKLSEVKRNDFYERIKEVAVSYGIGHATPEEIDTVNIYQATKLAMNRAVIDLEIPPDFLLVDAMTLSLPIAQRSIIKGDANSLSIAAASVLAKVTRDRLMNEYHEQYPEYKFISNSGYGTKEHIEALRLYGATPIHRTSFAPVKLNQ